MNSLSLICLGFLFSKPNPLYHQEKAPHEFTIPVWVYDEQGRTVDHLSLSDFVVKVNGKVVDISFLRRDTPPTLPSSHHSQRDGKPSREVQSRDPLVIILDLTSSTPKESAKSFVWLDSFLKNHTAGFRIKLYDLGQGALSAGFLTDPHALSQILAQTKEDYFDAVLDQNLENAILPGLSGKRMPPKASTRPFGYGKQGFLEPGVNRLKDLEKACADCLSFFGNSTHRQGCVAKSLSRFFAEHRQRALGVTAGLDRLVRSLPQEPSLSLVFFTPGFPQNGFSSAFQLAIRYRLEAQRENGSTLSTYEPHPHLDAETMDLISRLHDGSMIFHSVFLMSGQNEFTAEMAKGPRLLSETTGGSFNTGSAPLNGLIQALKRRHEAYRLSFTGTPREGAAPYQIEVTVSRKGVRLSYPNRLKIPSAGR